MITFVNIKEILRAHAESGVGKVAEESFLLVSPNGMLRGDSGDRISPDNWMRRERWRKALQPDRTNPQTAISMKVNTNISKSYYALL